MSGLGFAVAVEGIETFNEIKSLGPELSRLASMAINTTASRKRTAASKLMREEVAFKARYLDSKASGRLSVASTASAKNLEAVIEGRFRATSLEQFVTSAKTPGKRNPTVMVSPGSRQKMAGAFLMKLKRGLSMTDEVNNIGLAIRLKPGESLRNKRSYVKVSSGLYLLYGPSVDQVFRSVAKDIAPETADYLETEFTRLLEAKI
jgi:hypothetical protein